MSSINEKLMIFNVEKTRGLKLQSLTIRSSANRARVRVSPAFMWSAERQLQLEYFNYSILSEQARN